MRADLAHIFSQARAMDRNAQRWLYEQFSGKMLGIANSYIGNLHDAEDVLINAFYKAFTQIEQCKSAEHFPFWLRRIVINDAISFIRKKKNIIYVEVDWADDYEEEIEEEQELNIEEILAEMPLGYKLVFNLAIFEEKKHNEIAEMLNISEGTSKSQLSKAKKWLREYLTQNKKNEKIKE